MALRLEFLSVIVRREALAGATDLPAHFDRLHRDGGVVYELSWYDAHLYRDGAMSAADLAADVRAWEARGLVLGRDFAIVPSHTGPGDCAWLNYDARGNSVWLAGTDAGEIVGGHAWVQERLERLAALEAEGERAYAAMYDARRPKDDYDDARGALTRAVALARFLHRADVARLAARLAHVTAVYDSQFRDF